MYPDLSYVFHDLFGTPADNWTSIFKVYGIFLVLAILIAARILYVELRRKSREGKFMPVPETFKEGGPATYRALAEAAIWGFFLGFKIPWIVAHFAEFQADAARTLFSWKGWWWSGLFGMALYAGYTWYVNRNKVLVEKTLPIYPHQRIGEITIIAALAGVAGAKLFSILEDPAPFFQNPWRTVFSGAGLTIYGGLIGGFIAVWLYLRRKGIAPIHVLDAVAPALMVAYGVGRLGCHFSGDGDWGIAAAAQPEWWFLPSWLWSMDYPRNIINEGVAMSQCAGKYCSRLPTPVYPSSVYEAVMAFSLGGILWALRRKVAIPGMLFFIYLIFNGLERFWIEKIRINEKYHWAGLQFTQAELIAVLLFLTGIAGVLYLRIKSKR